MFGKTRTRQSHRRVSDVLCNNLNSHILTCLFTFVCHDSSFMCHDSLFMCHAWFACVTRRVHTCDMQYLHVWNSKRIISQNKNATSPSHSWRHRMCAWLHPCVCQHSCCHTNASSMCIVRLIRMSRWVSSCSQQLYSCHVQSATVESRVTWVLEKTHTHTHTLQLTCAVNKYNILFATVVDCTCIRNSGWLHIVFATVV